MAALDYDIVIRISVAREKLRKHVPAKKNSWPRTKGFPLSGNGTVNNFQLGSLQKYQTSISRQRAVNKFRQQYRPCFLCGPCGGYIERGLQNGRKPQMGALFQDRLAH
jgi:hypothetical protein